MKITDKAIRLFEFTLTSTSWTPANAGAALGWCANEITGLLSELELLNLLHHSSGTVSGWEVTSPRRAASAVLVTEQAEVARRQLESIQLQETLGALESTYLKARAGLDQRPASCVVEQSRTALEILADMMHLADSQVRVAHAGPGLSEQFLSTTLQNDLMALQRGVGVKVLLQHATRSHLRTRSWVTTLVGAGAEVRTVPAVPARIALIDDDCAIVPHGWDTGETSLVHESGIVRHLAAGFDANWATSKDYPVDQTINQLVPEPEMRAEVRRKVLELLAQGATDDSVARSLKVSSRTARRHVADVMRDLGASSRFQAGILVERDGLLDLGPL